jgi:hypothetical protein
MHRLPTWSLQLTRPIHLHGLRSWNVQPIDRKQLISCLHRLRSWNLQPIDRKQLFNRLHCLCSWNLQHCRPIRLHGLRSWNLQPVDRKQFINRMHLLLSWNLQPVDGKDNRLYRLRSWNLQHCWPICLHGLRSRNLQSFQRKQLINRLHCLSSCNLQSDDG